MIELCNVTKRYGTVEAVSGLSFSAPDGQIVGLLGQNGAGKTTTLNMLTGYFPPTSGEVRVDGMDMLQDPRACKRHIGYLPEKPPLYDEMTVTAYLKFVCELREVKREAIAQHVQHITATCGLTEVAGRLVGHLSKGYRQRVGIAQALCGDPDVLVLDEPTVGLDPKQVREIRELIRQLGKTHTVIFSSHLLPEIQQLCDRVVILHKGKLVREAPMSELTGGDGETLRFRATIAMKERLLVPSLNSLECVKETERGIAQAQLFRLLAGLDAPLMQLTPVRDTLEEVFLRATTED